MNKTNPTTWHVSLMGDRVTISRLSASGGMVLAGHGDYDLRGIYNAPCLGDDDYEPIEAALAQALELTQRRPVAGEIVVTRS